MDNNCLSKRKEIEDTLHGLHEAIRQQRAQDDAKREIERDLTRSLVRLAQLETNDVFNIVQHTSCVSRQNEIRRLCDQIRALEDSYQQEKRKIASIPDKKLRHECVQKEKQKRDESMFPLRDQLQLLDPTIDPLVSISNAGSGINHKLPSIGNAARRPVRSASYRNVMDDIRALQKTRNNELDPYVVNWKIAKLWNKINEHERCLENYEKACKQLTERQRNKIPIDKLEHVLEIERQRRRDASFYLFNKSLEDGSRQAAADHISTYLALSLPSERISTVECVESILRSQDYVEDPSMTTPGDVTVNILCTKSLGPLTDLRFKLLEELLIARPQDPYVLEAIARLHVRKHDYIDAKSACDRFIQLPDVKKLHLYTTFSEYSPSSM